MAASELNYNIPDTVHFSLPEKSAVNACSHAILQTGSQRLVPAEGTPHLIAVGPIWGSSSAQGTVDEAGEILLIEREALVAGCACLHNRKFRRQGVIQQDSRWNMILCVSWATAVGTPGSKALIHEEMAWVHQLVASRLAFPT